MVDIKVIFLDSYGPVESLTTLLSFGFDTKLPEDDQDRYGYALDDYGTVSHTYGEDTINWVLNNEEKLIYKK